MTKVKRKIIKIDEEKCDGCGLCIDACHEGAIQLIDGKAKLVSDIYCDGLGDCIGECPQGAITFEEREALPYDEEAVKKRMDAHHNPKSDCGCPGSAVRSMENDNLNDEEDITLSSRLSNWPIQLRLMPINAPYLRNANLVIAADCVSFSYADFHRRFLHNRVLIIGCPKLDNASSYLDKLTEMFRTNKIRSINVVYMEVPCCLGLLNLVIQAVEDSESQTEVTATKISIDGKLIEEVKYNII